MSKTKLREKYRENFFIRFLKFKRPVGVDDKNERRETKENEKNLLGNHGMVLQD